MPKLVQISFSMIPDDPRVRRHNDALQSLGWDVAALGLAGGRSHPPNWPILAVSPPAVVGSKVGGGTDADTASGGEQSRRRPFIKTLARLAWFTLAIPFSWCVWLVGWFSALLGRPSGTNLQAVAKVIRTDIGWPVRVLRRLRQQPVTTVEGAMEELERRFPVQGMIKAGQALGPTDVWVANDWPALPVAAALQARFGGQIAYDSHEFGTEEYAQDWAWRRYERPIAVTIEGHFIGQAKAITAVSRGIVEALRNLYQVPCLYDLVINAPPFQARAHMPAATPIKLLYHGIVVPGRGLELLIEAAKYWGEGAVLSIRGPCKPDYRETLQTLIATHQVGNKVTLLEPVAMTDLVEAARAFDMGIMALPGHSGQNRFALPNKIFEYLAAGLGLIVSDLPEMTALVTSTGTGLVLESDRVEAVARQIANLTPDRVNVWKSAALEAAKTYNGGQSAATLDNLYRAIVKEGA
jgi:glycosyltransferase involved in cell wall biosynthesis